MKTHNEPVMGNNEQQINKQIFAYSRFNEERIPVDKHYMSTLSPHGRWDVLNIQFADIPRFVAGTLLYKRHMWQVFVLVDDTAHFGNIKGRNDFLNNHVFVQIGLLRFPD